MIAWKQAYTVDGRNQVIVKLFIPDDAKVCYIPKGRNLQFDRCRCDKALVLDITSRDGFHRVERAVSMHSDNHHRSVIYEVGRVARPSSYSGDNRRRFAPGLYFFWDRQQALDYVY